MHILGKVAQFELKILDLESKDGCECWLHLGDTRGMSLTPSGLFPRV